MSPLGITKEHREIIQKYVKDFQEKALVKPGEKYTSGLVHYHLTNEYMS